MPPEKPIPVDVAAAIGRDFEKSAVIVVAYEPSTRLTHVATWGANAEARGVAAIAGDRIVAMLTGTTAKKLYEDFRAEADPRFQQAVHEEALRLLAEKRQDEGGGA